MICKLITYGQDRSEALALMRKALDSYVIKGVQHNIPLLRDIIEQPHFISGDTSTNFLPETYPDSFHGYQMKEGQSAQLAASAVYMSVMRVILSRTVGLLGLLCVVSSIVGELQTCIVRTHLRTSVCTYTNGWVLNVCKCIVVCVVCALFDVSLGWMTSIPAHKILNRVCHPHIPM